MNRTRQVAGGIILLVIIGVLLIHPVSAQMIKAPAKITVPGVYELSEDARGITDVYGISIECSNVVLDGGNHFIGGEGREKSVGVYVNQYGGSITNITVKNLLLEKWETGINYKYVKGEEGDTNLITGCDIVDTITAIHVEYSDYVQVNENRINGCSTGVTIDGLSTYTGLEKNTIKDTGLGIGITNSRYSTIEENNINTCSVYGLQVTDSEYTTITQNGIADNKYSAIMIENSRESDISGNTLTKTETGPVLSIGNEVRYASITNNYFGSYEAVSVDEVSSEIAWNSTQAPGTNILGGPYMGGNYWGSAPGAKGYSDTAPDTDGFGIADKPYQINEYNIDYLPLTPTTATVAPEDQVDTPGEEENAESSANVTEGADLTPAPAGDMIPGTPAVINNTSSTASQDVTLAPVENSPLAEPVPDNMTPEVIPAQTSAPVNSSIMNRSLTNAYLAEGAGGLPEIIPGAGNGTSQSLPSDPAIPANVSAPAQVGYLAFNVSQPGYQVTLTTATGTEVSLDQADGTEFIVPVPVQGLVYSMYRIVCEGYIPVSGKISPYPKSGEMVLIPVTLVPESVASSLTPVQPALVESNVSLTGPVVSPVQTPVTLVPKSVTSPLTPVQPALVESNVSLTEPVVSPVQTPVTLVPESIASSLTPEQPVLVESNVSLTGPVISPVQTPVTLVPESIASSLTPEQPVLAESNVSLTGSVVSPVQTPANYTPEVIFQAIEPVIAAVNDSAVSLPEPVVITNGIVSEGDLNTSHTIKAFSGKGGSVDPAGDVNVPDRGSASFNITPDDGHQISFLVIDGIQTGPMSGYQFINVTADHTISAGFT